MSVRIQIILIGLLLRLLSSETKSDGESVDENYIRLFNSPLLQFSDSLNLEIKDTPEIALHQETFDKILRYFHTLSPPHLTVTLYDDQFKGIDALLVSFSKTSTAISIAKFSPVLPVSSLVKEVLSFSWNSASIKRIHVFLACSMLNIAAVFGKVTSENLENPWVWWFVITDDANAVDLLQGILREGSQVIVIYLFERNSPQVFFSKVDSSGHIRFQVSNFWKPAQSNFMETDALLLGFTDLDLLYSDFQGRNLIATANNNNPFILMTQRDDGEMILEAGFEATIIKSLSQALNFTYSMRSPIDGKWGGRIANGSVVGMIGDVFRRDAHFAICEITITGSREEVIDFTSPYYIESLTLVSRSPREMSRAFGVLSPFTLDVWMGIVFLVIVFCPLLVILRKISDECSSEEDEDDVGDHYTLGNISFIVVGSLLRQENLFSPKHWSLRSTFIMWYLFSLLVSALYSSMLIASLVKPSFEKPINGLTDLPRAIKDGGYTLVVTADTSNEYLFKNARDGIYEQTWGLFNHEDRSKSFPINSDNSYDGILKEKLVFIAGQTGARYRSMTRGIRRYYFARDTFSPQFYGMACFAGAPFQFKFSQMMSFMVEGGLITKWLSNEFAKVSVKDAGEMKRGPKPFSLVQLQAAFYLLGIGHLSATVLLCLEIITTSF